MCFYVEERFKDAEGPCDEHHARGLEMLDQLVQVLCATLDVIARRRNLRIALRARVVGDDAVAPGEVIDLRAPDFGWHQPPGNEDQSFAGASLDEMQAHAVAAGEKLRRLPVRLGGIRLGVRR